MAVGLFWAEGWLFWPHFLRYRLQFFLPHIHIKIDSQTKLEVNRTLNYHFSLQKATIHINGYISIWELGFFQSAPRQTFENCSAACMIRCANYGLLHARVIEVSAQNCSAAWLGAKVSVTKRLITGSIRLQSIFFMIIFAAVRGLKFSDTNGFLI